MIQAFITRANDDTTLLVGQHSSVDIIQEYDNIYSWSAIETGQLSTMIKQKNVFCRPASGHLNIPLTLPDTERVTLATLLGTDITSTLSTSVRMLLQTRRALGRAHLPPTKVFRRLSE